MVEVVVALLAAVVVVVLQVAVVMALEAAVVAVLPDLMANLPGCLQHWPATPTHH